MCDGDGVGAGPHCEVCGVGVEEFLAETQVICRKAEIVCVIIVITIIIVVIVVTPTVFTRSTIV